MFFTFSKIINYYELDDLLEKRQDIHEDLVELKNLYYAMWRQQIGERK